MDTVKDTIKDPELDLLGRIVDEVKQAGQIMLEADHIDEGVKTKQGHANFVTAYDERIQNILTDRLQKILPEAGFVGEENGKEVFLPEYRSGFVFVVDPIDGTLNFMNGYRLSVVSVGLFKDGRPYMGVVYNPYSNDCFTGCRGKGAWRNGRKIMSSDKPLEDSLVLFGTSPYNSELRKKSFALAMDYASRSEDIRRSGAAEWDLCMVACGCAGLFFELTLGLWDYAAGALILQEAGGRITDELGNELTYEGRSGVVAVSRGVSSGDYLPEPESADI